jgi:predicted transposase/invertase (TIGR01784 family)
MAETIYGLLNDTVFKYVFTDRRAMGPLRHLLNSLLGLEGDDRIEEGALTLESPVKIRAALDDYGASFDALAMDTRKRIYHVEVQRLEQKYAGVRLLYYLAHHFERQLKRGGWYGDLRRTVTLAILDFNLFPGEPEGSNLFEVCTRGAGLVLAEDMRIQCYELKKLTLHDPCALGTSREKWLHLLKHSEWYYHAKGLPGPLAEEEGMEMVMERMKEVNRKPKLRTHMEAMEKLRMDNANYIHGIMEDVEEKRRKNEEFEREVEEKRREAEEKRREAEEKRREAEEKRREAEEKRREAELATQRAREIERKAQEEKREMARAMKAEGIDAAVIMRITGLSEGEIRG